jgi:hypothetical protein
MYGGFYLSFMCYGLQTDAVKKKSNILTILVQEYNQLVLLLMTMKFKKCTIQTIQIGAKWTKKLRHWWPFRVVTMWETWMITKEMVLSLKRTKTNFFKAQSTKTILTIRMVWQVRLMKKVGDKICMHHLKSRQTLMVRYLGPPRI